MLRKTNIPRAGIAALLLINFGFVCGTDINENPLSSKQDFNATASVYENEDVFSVVNSILVEQRRSMRELVSDMVSRSISCRAKLTSSDMQKNRESEIIAGELVEEAQTNSETNRYTEENFASRLDLMIHNYERLIELGNSNLAVFFALLGSDAQSEGDIAATQMPSDRASIIDALELEMSNEPPTLAQFLARELDIVNHFVTSARYAESTCGNAIRTLEERLNENSETITPEMESSKEDSGYVNPLAYIRCAMIALSYAISFYSEVSHLDSGILDPISTDSSARAQNASTNKK